MIVGEGGWTRRRGRTCSPSARRTSCPSPAPSAARTSSTTGRARTPASSASRWTTGWRRGSARPTSSSRSAAGSERCRRAATRCSSVPRPRQTLVHAHPDPDELGFVYRPDLPIACGLPELAAALRQLEPVEPRWLEWTQAARADYEANLRHEPMEGPVDLGEIMAFLREAAARRRDPDLRRGQLHRLGAPVRRVHAVRHAGLSAQRLDGLRRRRGDRGEARPPRPDRPLLHGRRRLRDELAGVRHRRAVRAADHRAPRQQRHVRDDPDAPGAAVPRPRDRDGSRQPGLPRAGAVLRRLRGAGRADGRLRGGVRASARLRACRRCSSCRSTPSGSARGSGSASCRRRRDDAPRVSGSRGWPSRSRTTRTRCVPATCSSSRASSASTARGARRRRRRRRAGAAGVREHARGARRGRAAASRTSSR